MVTYDANQSFVNMELAASPSSSFGQFSVGYGIAPGTFNAFASAQHTDSFSGNPNIQGYFVNNPQIVPAVAVNISSAPTTMVTIGSVLSKDQIYLHPGAASTADAEAGPIQNAILRFTAPISGLYTIVGDWAKLHFGTTSDQILVNGVLATPATSGTSSFNFAKQLNANDHVDFVVNPAGVIAGDSTGLRAKLTLCTPPQVLQNGACSSPSTIASDLTLAKLAKDAYVKFPPLSMFPGHEGIDGYTLLRQVDSDQTGFKANVYQNGDQIVISVRGTNPEKGNALIYNLLADQSFIPGNSATDYLTKNVNELATLLGEISTKNPNAQITLTGHSLGGAVAQIVGAGMGLHTVSFDAPGAKPLYTDNLLLYLIPVTVGKTKGSISTPDVGIVQYRLQGDQVSKVGNTKSVDAQFATKIVTVPFSQSRGVVTDINSPFAQSPGVVPELINIAATHSMDNLVTAMGKNACPAACVAGYGSESTLPGKVLTAIMKACASSPTIGTNPGLTRGIIGAPSCANIVVSAKKDSPQFPDPPPGNRYLIMLGAGSPFANEIMLPTLTTVFGWSLAYHDQNGWSSFVTKMGFADYLFSTDVDGFDFIPLDANGNEVFNTDYFAYGISFSSDGDVVLVQTAYGAAPEPETIALMLLALGLMGVVRHRRT